MKPATAFTAALAAGALAFPASAQWLCIYSNVPGQPTAQVPGRPPGVSFFPSTTESPFGRPFASPAGLFWSFTARTTEGPALDHLIILGSGAAGIPAAQSGTPVPFAPDRLWVGFDQRVSPSDEGLVAFAARLSGDPLDDAVIAVVDPPLLGFPAFREGQPVPGLPPGTAYDNNLNAASLLPTGQVAAIASIFGPDVNPNNNAILSIGPLIAARKGVTIPLGSFTPWQNFDFEAFFVASDGRYIVRGDDFGPAGADQIAVVNNAVVLRENQTIPGLPSPIAPDGIGPVFMAAGADWTARGTALNPADDWVVANGTLVARTGQDITPLFPAGETWSDSLFPEAFHTSIHAETGDLVIGGYTNNPDPGLNQVLVANRQVVIARAGEPVDLDGNGAFDDDAFIAGFLPDSLIFGPDRSRIIYIRVPIRDANGNIVGYGWLCKAVSSFQAECPPDFNGDGFLDFFDLDAFIECFEGVACPPGRSADYNADGFIDFFDLDAFITDFETGC
ncbi:MAG: hypothetical protein HRU70_07070 [Phycisphaeraceae bacterium]|nr:MAG: hypothetical protein HRU70_07070 [Phycisphaeraceae bacterium]